MCFFLLSMKGGVFILTDKLRHFYSMNEKYKGKQKFQIIIFKELDQKYSLKNKILNNEYLSSDVMEFLIFIS